MRDIALTIILLVIVPLILYRPHIGVLAWAWISFMNPHMEVYSFLQGANLNLLIAILTIIGLLLYPEKQFPKYSRTLVVMIVFAGWTTLTTVAALNYDFSFDIWLRNMKIFIFVIIIAALIDRPSRLHALILIIIISMGYWGAVSSQQTIASFGQASLTGPATTMIGDNNSLALALVMTLPLVEYCRYVSSKKIISIICVATIILMVIAIFGTYSRGGLIALLVVSALFFWKSKNRMIATSIVLICVAFITLLPQKWSDRMATIQTYEADQSFQGRVAAWKTAIRIGLNRPLIGAGYRATEDPAIYGRFKEEGDATTRRAVHNAYLQVLADHGFVGLSLFALMFFFAIRDCRWVAKRCSNIPNLYWLAYLASMMEIAFVGYAVAAMALSVAYYDMFLVLVVVSSVIRNYAQREVSPLGAHEELATDRIPATSSVHVK